MTRIRLLSKERKEQILKEAINLSVKSGYASITYKKLAGILKVTPSLLYHYFPNIKALKKEILKRARTEKNLSILAQALASKELSSENLDPELKRTILEFL